MRHADCAVAHPRNMRRDGIIAGNLTAFLAVAGTLYEAARYSGPVD
jgi:hypothetical protein